MKIVFSPCLIEYTGNDYRDEHMHFEKISEIVDFIFDCINNPEIDYFHNTLFNNLYFVIPKYSVDTSLNNKIRADILPKIQKFLSDLIDTNKIDYNTLFINYFSYLTKKHSPIVVFVGESNKHFEGIGFTAETCINKECIVLFNPYICEYDIIKDIIRDNITTDIALCKDICKHTNKYFEPYRKLKDSERNEFDFHYGEIVATRNKYIYNHRLSDINTRHNSGRRRDVYVKYTTTKRKPEYYISVDTEHGAIEVFKHRKSGNPEHIGEFNFSCKPTKNSEPNSHKLYLK